ncbi:MAG: PocR ligand-binding domain-containing protein [Erysipelotrichaceae bacterium]|nr:PocR ligand-binding domain-containing protein [Erysipelotrichaceae bacterium]
MDDIQHILKDLYIISRFNMSLFDTHFNLVASYPNYKAPFCALIEKSDGFKYCQQFDHDAFLKVKETGQIYIYQCYFNLYEACVPIYTYGVLSGYLMMGQNLTTSPIDRKIIEEKALPYVKNPDLLSDAIDAIPVHSKEKILSFASIVDVCAKYLTLTNQVESKNEQLAKQTMAYLQQNYASNISIQKLCDIFYCSKGTLNNHFKQEYHISIHQYLSNLRLEKAIELLHNPNLSIGEIAITVGFNDTNYFTKAFRKKYNCTPLEYRNKQ